MKKRNLLITLAVLILGLLVFLLYQISLLAKSKWVYKGYKLKSFSLDQIELYLYFNVYNQSLVDVILAQQDYDVYLNNYFISKVSNKMDSKINADTVSAVPFLVTIKYGDAVKAGLNNITALLTKSGRENIRIKIMGTVTLKSGPLVLQRLPFEKDQPLKEMNGDDKV